MTSNSSIRSSSQNSQSRRSRSHHQSVSSLHNDSEVMVLSESPDSDDEMESVQSMELCDSSEYGSDNDDYDFNDDEDDEYEYDYGSDDGSEVSQEIKTTEKQSESSDGPNGEGVVMTDEISLLPVMNRQAKSITEALNIPIEAVIPCLRNCKWDEQRLMESFINDSEKLTEDVGVYHRCKANAASDDHTLSNNPQKTDATTQFTCQICFDDLSQDKMYAMPCEHHFCLECWSQYISTKLEGGPSCIAATCPDFKCKELLTEVEVKKIVPNLYDTFVSYQLRNFIEDRSTSRWCPGADCKYIATLPGTQTLSEHGMPVFCHGCSTSFCLGCGDSPHAPLICADMLSWKENYETTGSESWILQNTKPCPKCHVRIEKNNGCSHMTCKQCRHEFCWICLGDWKTHSQCNRFDSNATHGKDRELARNLHYIKRYQIHGDAKKFAEKELVTVTEKLSNSMFSVEEGETLVMVEELKEPVIKANNELLECRKTLMNTYVYAYLHLHKDEKKTDNAIDKIHSEQFEYHQEMLERFTEELSELTEKPLKDMVKMELVNKTEAVKKFRDRIVSYVMNEMY